MKNIINLIVKDNENGQRVDQFISNKEKDLSRTRIKNLILNKKLKINKNTISDPSKKVSTNDYINLEIPKPKKAPLKPFNFKLEIAYEDKDLLVVNKPAGISMHPGAGDYDKTLVNGTVNYENIINAFYLNGFYLILSISVFYYSFDKAREKGTLINMGE